MGIGSGELREVTPGRHGLSLFKYLVGGAALFIAGCSAYFSVSGLGLLFIGSASAVMVMAASLELGKLVAASFLYRYWSQLTLALRVYLTLAVIVLIGITSLGNYGYLARAYEQTKTQIAMQEGQIQAVQQEIDDTQKQIDGSRSQIGKSTDLGREDVDKLQQMVGQANAALEQSLARLEDRRRAAKDKRDRDMQTLNGQMTEMAGVLKDGLKSEDDVIAQLNERVAVLDRAVDAYTSQGGPGFLKDDGVRKGQTLRTQQMPERNAIAARIDEGQKKQEQLRADNAKATAALTAQMTLVQNQNEKDLAALDGEEQSLRKSRDESVAAAQAQLTALQTRNQTASSQGGNQIEAMYQLIRMDNDAIARIRQQIAATDIGSYRFVARAFNAPADDVVKWLMLVMVLVFDPLAVTLTVGFNVAVMRDRKIAGTAAASTSRSEGAAGLRRWPRFAAVGMGLIVISAIAVGGIYYGAGVVRNQEQTSHASMIPGDSFAVMTLCPWKLHSSQASPKLAEMFGNMAGHSMTDALTELAGNGLDANAAIYGFVKYPSGKTSAAGDRPVMVCGFVARVTDARAAEGGLCKFADALAASLGHGGAMPGITRSREMIRFGRGKYLDPDGGFFTFGVTEHEAIVLLEVEGDPNHPTVESEMRQCLAVPDAGQQSYGPVVKLPARATGSDAPVSLWFDAGRCFSEMPKNAAAMARYQELQRYLAFDVVLTARASGQGELDVAGDYNYTADRFRPGNEPSVADTLNKLGPVDSAAIAGRLMDRCAATVDFDGLIEQLKVTLARAKGGAGADVMVEKTIGSTRDGKFVLSAHYDGQAGNPVASAIENLVH